MYSHAHFMQHILRKSQLYGFVPPEENPYAYDEWRPKYNLQHPHNWLQLQVLTDCCV
jgi:hypothetical protein